MRVYISIHSTLISDEDDLSSSISNMFTVTSVFTGEPSAGF